MKTALHGSVRPRTRLASDKTFTASRKGELLDLSPKRIAVASYRIRNALPVTPRLLTDGGDARIVCGTHGSNKYGCSAVPAPDVLAYGSSTASTISSAGFAAADALRERLQIAARNELAPVTYERELDRVRHELTTLCGLEQLSGLQIIFGASGTDLHLFASQLMLDAGGSAPLIIRVEAAETGRGVPDALAGRHFSDCAALGDVVTPNAPIDCGLPLEIVEVRCRAMDGTVRSVSEVDAEVVEAVARTVAKGRRVLITLVDVSKTGLLAPSPACVDALRRQFPDSVEVLVDACQFRLAPSTLRAYLEHNFLVAITGSKFITGPTFCGALLIPEVAARRLRNRKLPHALKSYSARADWPRGWPARSALKNIANYGLLLRWEAGLTELRAFRQLPDTAIKNFLTDFTNRITIHFASDPAFELLPAPKLDRAPIAVANSWDHLTTIFSFLLLRRSASGEPVWLNPGETAKVQELLREDIRHIPGASALSLFPSYSQVGQPVPCGTRAGAPVSALRLA